MVEVHSATVAIGMEPGGDPEQDAPQDSGRTGNWGM
jgi:hypothetical protein